MQAEVSVALKNHRKQQQAKKRKADSPLSLAAVTQMSGSVPHMPTIPTAANLQVEPPKAKKKKQKIISTGSGKTYIPNQKLYCVCKTPYDETR